MGRASLCRWFRYPDRGVWSLLFGSRGDCPWCGGCVALSKWRDGEGSVRRIGSGSHRHLGRDPSGKLVGTLRAAALARSGGRCSRSAGSEAPSAGYRGLVHSSDSADQLGGSFLVQCLADRKTPSSRQRANRAIAQRERSILRLLRCGSVSSRPCSGRQDSTRARLRARMPAPTPLRWPRTARIDRVARSAIAGTCAEWTDVCQARSLRRRSVRRPPEERLTGGRILRCAGDWWRLLWLRGGIGHPSRRGTPDCRHRSGEGPAAPRVVRQSGAYP